MVPIFAGFGAGAIATRLEDSGARVLFTADHLQRRGKLLPLKDKIENPPEKRDRLALPQPRRARWQRGPRHLVGRPAGRPAGGLRVACRSIPKTRR